MAAGRKALVVATYRYADGGLRQLTAPEHDAEAFAAVLEDPEIAGFDVTVLVNEPHHVVGEAIADFYGGCRRDDLTLLYFSGHGLKDDEGRLHLAMTNTRREALLFTAVSAAQLNEAMDACASRRKVLILDCCYSGAFPAGRTAKADEGVQTLERFQGKGRAVLTASDATQYAFEGDALSGSASSSVFTRHLVEAIRTGAADLDEDGDIALDELYSYVREQVVAELPQQRPKKQEDVDGRIVIARNVHWTLPTHLRHAIESPIAAQRLSAVEGLAHLHRVGNDVVRTTVAEHLEALAADDSRSVSAVATAELERIGRAGTRPAEAVPAPRRVPLSETATVPAAAPRRPAVASPAPAPAPPAPEPPARSRSPAAPRTVPFVLLPLILVAGVLLTVARFLVFEPVNGYHAVDLSWSTAGWVAQVLLPLVAALGVLLARPRSPAATALAAGMVAGVLLGVVGQLWMSAAITLDPDVGYALGPAWWLLLVAALVLGCAVAAALLTPALRARTGIRRRPAAAWGGALVVASAVGWLLVGPVSNDFGWFLHLRIAGLLLTAACLAVAVLDLGPEQRLFGLAAVTTNAIWLAAVAVEFLAVQPAGLQSGPLVLSLCLALLPVGGAYLGQARREDPALP